MRPARLLLPLLLILVLVLALNWRRHAGEAARGPAVALCPGPDAYGTTCAGAEAYAYIDATDDTELYADDGTVRLALPFPFTFYGETYTALTASSNGNLQLVGANPDYANRCLDRGPAPGMGAMIAPYWDDLDLTLAGFLETATVGEAPRRIFVIEWDDVPRFDAPDDRATFAVQLFEEDQAIVFLYQEVETTEAPRGASATVGLQSEAAGLALQFSCNQPSLGNGRGLLWRQPDDQGPPPAAATTPAAATGPIAKGETPALLAAWRRGDEAGLRQIQAAALRAERPRPSQWQRADLTGDGHDELVWLWAGPTARLVVLGAGGVLLDAALGNRRLPAARPALAAIGDVTGDGRVDVLIADHARPGLWLLAAPDGVANLAGTTTACPGAAHIVRADGSEGPTVVRDGCARAGRESLRWDGERLAPTP